MNQHLNHQTSLLTKLLDPVGRSLTPDMAQKLAHLHADPAIEKRLDELADKSTEGTLTEDERAEYEIYIHAIDFIAVLQAQARRLLKNTSMTHTS